ncbi:MAG: hypothetical protein VW879_06400, partial [Opitutae bacterium]
MSGEPMRIGEIINLFEDVVDHLHKTKGDNGILTLNDIPQHLRNRTSTDEQQCILTLMRERQKRLRKKDARRRKRKSLETVH